MGTWKPQTCMHVFTHWQYLQKNGKLPSCQKGLICGCCPQPAFCCCCCFSSLFTCLFDIRLCYTDVINTNHSVDWTLTSLWQLLNYTVYSSLYIVMCVNRHRLDITRHHNRLQRLSGTYPQVLMLTLEDQSTKANQSTWLWHENDNYKAQLPLCI